MAVAEAGRTARCPGRPRPSRRRPPEPDGRAGGAAPRAGWSSATPRAGGRWRWSTARSTTTGRCRRASSTPGESFEDAALREVGRRPGFAASSAPLEPASYRDRKGRTKLVRYFLMSPLERRLRAQRRGRRAALGAHRIPRPSCSTHEHDRRLVTALAGVVRTSSSAPSVSLPRPRGPMEGWASQRIPVMLGKTAGCDRAISNARSTRSNTYPRGGFGHPAGHLRSGGGALGAPPFVQRKRGALGAPRSRILRQAARAVGGLPTRAGRRHSRFVPGPRGPKPRCRHGPAGSAAAGCRPPPGPPPRRGPRTPVAQAHTLEAGDLVGPVDRQVGHDQRDPHARGDQQRALAERPGQLGSHRRRARSAHSAARALTSTAAWAKLNASSPVCEKPLKSSSSMPYQGRRRLPAAATAPIAASRSAGCSVTGSGCARRDPPDHGGGLVRSAHPAVGDLGHVGLRQDLCHGPRQVVAGGEPAARDAVRDQHPNLVPRRQRVLEWIVPGPGLQPGGPGLGRHVLGLRCDSRPQLICVHLLVGAANERPQRAAVVGFDLLEQRLDHGLRGGERVALSKLRRPIGAPPAQTTATIRSGRRRRRGPRATERPRPRRSPPARRALSAPRRDRWPPVAMSYGPVRVDRPGAAIVVADDPVVALELRHQRLERRGVHRPVAADHDEGSASRAPRSRSRRRRRRSRWALVRLYAGPSGYSPGDTLDFKEDRPCPRPLPPATSWPPRTPTSATRSSSS